MALFRRSTFKSRREFSTYISTMQSRNYYSKYLNRNFDKVLWNPEDKRLASAVVKLEGLLGKKGEKIHVKTPHPTDFNTL